MTRTVRWDVTLKATNEHTKDTASRCNSIIIVKCIEIKVDIYVPLNMFSSSTMILSKK